MRLINLIAFLVTISMSTPHALGANYFNWGVESETTSDGTVQAYRGGSPTGATTARSTDTSHTGNYALKLTVIGNDGNNQQLGVDLPHIDYPWAIAGSNALYYRWWMRINSGFSWGNATAKAKSSRVLVSPSVANGYTGYIGKNGFYIGECSGGGCLTNTGATSTDSNIAIPFNFSSMADSVWHEYVVKVKPNTVGACTAGVDCDAQFSAWVDGNLVGSYDNWKLHSNASDLMVEAWAGWMEKPYFQLGGTASDGGTIYLDDFSTDDVFNSTYTAPATVRPTLTGYVSGFIK